MSRGTSVPDQTGQRVASASETALWVYLSIQPSIVPSRQDASADSERPFFDPDADPTYRVAPDERGELEGIDPEFRPIGDVEARFGTAGDVPNDHASAWFSQGGEIVQTMGFSRAQMESLVLWEAPALAHRPLIFEEPNFERHGYSVGLFQPAFSAAHFFGRIPALPYLLVSEHHHQTTYSLGHFRPGSFAPYKLHRPRFTVTGLAVETAAVVGMLYLIP